MRMSRSLWNKFLSRIGILKPSRKRKPAQSLPARRLRLESLETRQLLSAAATLYWDPNGSAGLGGAGTWDASSANWRRRSAPARRPADLEQW